MYIPAWPNLSPRHLLAPKHRSPLPFPLNTPSSTYFYLARNGIYQLFKKLELDENDLVLVPDYHHGNEIFAMRAARARLAFYPVCHDLTMDLDAVFQLCRTL